VEIEPLWTGARRDDLLDGLFDKLKIAVSTIWQLWIGVVAEMNRSLVLAFACAVITASSFAQSTASSEPDAESSSTPGRQQLFDKAKVDFAAEHWSEALTEFSDLHNQFPANAKISEFLAESALNTGNTQLAISLMEPIRKASPARWQASALLARAYSESDRDAERDAEIANLQQLHDRKAAPRITQLQMILLDRRVFPNGSVRIWYALEPWGKSNTYLFAKIYDAQGAETYHVTLDSADWDQALWAKNHSKEAAAGERVFFLDGYTKAQKGSDGNSTFTQALLGIFDGKPAYDLIRDRILAIASAHPTPVAKTTPKLP
jgi:hypothetical protein